MEATGINCTLCHDRDARDDGLLACDFCLQYLKLDREFCYELYSYLCELEGPSTGGNAGLFEGGWIDAVQVAKLYNLVKDFDPGPQMAGLDTSVYNKAEAVAIAMFALYNIAAYRGQNDKGHNSWKTIRIRDIQPDWIWRGEK